MPEARDNQIRRTARIMEMIQQIATSPRYWTRRKLAEKHEISERMIQRRTSTSATTCWIATASTAIPSASHLTWDYLTRLISTLTNSLHPLSIDFARSTFSASEAEKKHRIRWLKKKIYWFCKTHQHFNFFQNVEVFSLPIPAKLSKESTTRAPYKDLTSPRRMAQSLILLPGIQDKQYLC